MSRGPAFDIELPVSAPWVWLVRSLIGLGLFATLLWWLGPAAEGDGGLRLGLALAAAVCCALAWGFPRARPCRLRLDDDGWSLAPRRPDEWQQGRLAVTLDLGGLMLLRFDTGAAPGRRAAHWLAVDRGSLGGQWHALRCAVYSAPPKGSTDLPVDRRARPLTGQNRPESHE